MSLSSALGAANILFFSDCRISKGMPVSEFGAVLDGVVGMPEFAAGEAKAAYVVVDGQLQIKACVLFLIRFDRNGYADRSWNVPLGHLADGGTKGPDLGGGPILLSCRSQCTISWLQPKLWDPVMNEDASDFMVIRDYIMRRYKALGIEVDQEDDIPVVGLSQQLPVITQADIDKQRIADAVRDGKEKYVRMIKDQRLHISTLENKSKEDQAKLKYGYLKKEEGLTSQLKKVMSKFKLLKEQNSALKKQASSQTAQIDSLNKVFTKKIAEAAEKGRGDLDVITEEYASSLEQRIEVESAKLKAEVSQRDMQLLDREEKIDQLKNELSELRQEQMEADTGNQAFLEQLEQLGLNFIVFHAGAGHVSIPFADLSRYMESPVGYAAEKCLVTEERYRAWLKHYEDPRCQVAVGGKACGSRVIRVDVPNQFEPGVSDQNQNRCQNCQCESSIDKVLSAQL